VAVVRIIDRLDAVGPEVGDLVPQLAQPLRQLTFQPESRVVGSQCNLHGAHIVRPRARRHRKWALSTKSVALVEELAHRSKWRVRFAPMLIIRLRIVPARERTVRFVLALPGDVVATLQAGTRYSSICAPVRVAERMR